MMMKTLKTKMVTSISEVMETMFYLPVEYSEDETIESSRLLTNNIEACSIRFAGYFSGSLYLLIPKSLLKIMAENFLGEEPANLMKSHFTGTMKETLNMIAGNTFSKINANTPFSLGVPEMLDQIPHNVFDTLLIIDTMEGQMALGLEIYPQPAA